MSQDCPYQNKDSNQVFYSTRWNKELIFSNFLNVKYFRLLHTFHTFYELFKGCISLELKKTHFHPNVNTHAKAHSMMNGKHWS